MTNVDDEMRAAKIEERQRVAHSIMLFFAMEKEEQDQYLPPIDPEVYYISDGDTGDKTMYPAYYFCARSMDYLAVYPPRGGRTISSMIYEMRDLISFMILISPDPKYDPSFPGSKRYSLIWLFGPPYAGVSGSGAVLWRFLRRYTRLILADPAWKFDYPLMPFEEIRKHFTVHT